MSGKGKAILALGMAGSGLTAGLGIWQLRRRQWKINLIKEREEKMAQTPTPLRILTSSDREDSDLLYQRVFCVGKMDYDNQFLVGPRALPKFVQKHHPDERSGYWVLTPLRLEDGSAILLNRGFAPRDAPPPPEPTTADGRVAVVAVLREGEAKPTGFSNAESGKSWLWMDVKNMMAKAGITRTYNRPPLFGDITEPALPQNPGDKTYLYRRHFEDLAGGGPITPTKHAIYAATWLSLSGTIALITLNFARKLRV